jgi:hypothetical protein
MFQEKSDKCFFGPFLDIIDTISTFSKRSGNKSVLGKVSGIDESCVYDIQKTDPIFGSMKIKTGLHTPVDYSYGIVCSEHVLHCTLFSGKFLNKRLQEKNIRK